MTAFAPAVAVPVTGPRTARALLESRAVRIGASILVLAFLVRQFGAGPFLDGVRATSPVAVLAALVITAGTTWCCAVRWSLVSARFGESVPLRTAFVAYYRSQLVNATLPSGVLGDVQRGVRHGLRPVVLERVLGQSVQIALTGLLLLPSPYRWIGPAAFLVVAVAYGGLVVLLSAGSVLGHLAVFLVAASSAGVPMSFTTLVPVGALVLLGSAIPLNLAGWGPREGVAAWTFTAFGSTASIGLTVSVTYGVLALVATLPGLLVGRRRRG